jgi:hypothetical protein
MIKTLGLIALRTSRSSSSKSIWDSILWIRPLRTSIDCITLLLIRLLITSTLCICDKSTLIMLCFYGNLMKFFTKNMLQFLLVFLLIELEPF